MSPLPSELRPHARATLSPRLLPTRRLRPRARLLTVGLCSAATVLAGAAASPLVSPAAAQATAAAGTAVAAKGSTPLRVGTFNIVSVSFDRKAKGNFRKWAVRRPVVAGQILGQRLDVVGLQEANQSNVYRRALKYGDTQWADLRGALNSRGGRYAVTNRYAYNCQVPTRQSRCRHKYRGAAQDNRILYNTRTVKLVRQGSVRFKAQARGKNPRFIAWAVFQSKRTGKRFFFANTHLCPYSTNVRKAQWRQVIRTTDRFKRSYPVVVVGDFNTSKFDGYSRSLLPAMKRRGYGDVLNQSYRKPVVRSRAASKKNVWINSYNGWKRDIRSYAYEDAKNKVGNSIDYVFASNRLRVPQVEVVANVNTRTNRIRGVMPSDHNMVRATLTLR